ncbi:MAG: glutamyl-tRNA reductase [Gemmatimonadaceae bacterium]
MNRYGSVHCIGISHRTAPAELRERLAFTPESVPGALRDARRDAGIERMVIVSTCHRTELYAEFGQGILQAQGFEANRLCQWMAEWSGVGADVIFGHARVWQGESAARHLFRLSAGLESPVTGEAQITGQIARALRHSVGAHAASPTLKRLFKEAVRTGERARSTVWSGQRAANIGTAAAAAAALHFEKKGRLFRDASISIVGAGELGELALAAVTSAGVRKVTMVNRTPERANHLAARLGAMTRSFDELDRCLAESDAAIFAMSGTRVLVGIDLLSRVMAARNGAALTLVDVALPRNVEPGIRDHPQVTLLDIDDVGRLGQGLYSERASATESVEAIVEESMAALGAAAPILPAGSQASAAVLQ